MRKTTSVSKESSPEIGNQSSYLKVQIKTTKCRSPCDLYISKNVSKHYAREKCEHINNKSTIQN